jgi:glutathione S-transferase
MPTLYDAPRCPFCARVRIVLAEKGMEVETVEVDLDDRPTWIYEKNETGRVPVLEEDGWLLPESAAIMEYLEERSPEPPLLPRGLEARAEARLAIVRFDSFGAAYYRLRRGDPEGREALASELERLDRRLAHRAYLAGGDYSLADVAYVPWVLRARRSLDVDLEPYPRLADWLARLCVRPAVAAEAGVVEEIAR